MKHIALAFLLIVSLQLDAQRSFFSRADDFFKQFVTAGLVNYKALYDDPDLLNSLVGEIADYSVVGKDPDTQKAFYCNAYNILVIKQIIDNYPTNSPMSIKGFFDGRKFEVAGKSMTLDEMEKRVLLPTFPDPRLHFILVCAAMGCPPIADYAYSPEKLDSLIENKTREVLNINWYVRISPNKTQISKVFEWYKQDFLNKSPDLKSYINQYRDILIPDSHELGTYEYDWSLNDSKNARY